MKINCIIIDDEPLARKGLQEYINDIGFLQLVGVFDTPLNAVDLINSGTVQLVFLDIEMPKINGLEFLRSLNNTVPVIFTTAFPQHAWEGFELQALDYLVKPIAFERFLKAALRVKEYYELRQKGEGVLAPAPGEDYFFVKADNSLMRVELDDILFIEALQNYVTIHMRERKLITYLTFKSIEEFLPSPRFIKTHKSYIVSAAKIDSIEGNDIKIGNRHIPISRSEKDSVLEKLLKGKFLKR